MPELDVSIVLDDPMFNKSIEVIKTNRSTKILGRVVPVYTRVPNVTAVLNPLKEEELNRLSAADRSKSPIFVWTRYHLSAGDKDWAPDEIIFRGKTWQVSKIADWSHYGEGFVKALCIEKDPTV